MFLSCITIGLVSVYLINFFFLPRFFDSALFDEKLKPSITSIVCIVLLSIIGYGISFSILDEALSNRFLHGFGGGFMAAFSISLSFRDMGFQGSALQYSVFLLFGVSFLGVCHEITEFLLQVTEVTHHLYATTITDTWLDLLSNTTGCVLGILLLFPLIKKHQSR